MNRTRAARQSLKLVLVLASGLGLPAPLVARPESEAEEAREPEAPRVEVHGVADVRFAASGEHRSWLDGGLGRLRYGGDDRDGIGDQAANAFHAGQLSLVVDARTSEEFSGHLHVNFDADVDRFETLQQVGIVEGFVSWNPVLSDQARLRVRGGIFIPPFSLEHPEVAWSTRYTITPSAIASWLGEELKSTGLEATLVLQTGAQSELQIQGSLYSGNDSTGALLAWRGWALHDRQGMIGDELPLPSILALTDPRFFTNQGLRTEPFREIDGRLGYDAQARWRLGPQVLLQGGWYDNLGDPQAVKRHDSTWHTRFALGGAQFDFGPVTVLGQYLDGRTSMGRASPALVDAPFRSGFGLISITAGESSRLSVRYDRWAVRDEDVWQAGKDLNTDDGWAATAAFIQSFGEHHRLQFEFIEAQARHPFAPTAGELASFNQQQFQVGYRLAF